MLGLLCSLKFELHNDINISVCECICNLYHVPSKIELDDLKVMSIVGVVHLSFLFCLFHINLPQITLVFEVKGSACL